MATPIGAMRFNIDATMDLPADGFAAETDGSAPFRTAAAGDEIELVAGYDDGGTPVTVQQILGKVDEWQLNVTPDSMTSTVSGRDKMGELLDRPFRKIFFRSPLGGQPLRILGVTVTPPPPTVDPDVPFSVGTFLASEIAREIVEAAGLKLAWQCRDYEMLQDFDASGRSLDLLRKLVEPWSQVERFKVDIFAQGNVVICRDRVAAPTADYTFPATDARILRMTIAKRRLPKFGTVKLLGKLVPPGLFLGAVAFEPSQQEETRVVQTFDAAGRVLETILTVVTFRRPDGVPIRKVETTFKGNIGGTILKEEVVETTYEEALYNESGAINQPRQLLETATHNGVLDGDPNKVFGPVRREEKSFGYDTLDFLSVITTKVFEHRLESTPRGTFRGPERQTQEIVETLRDLDNLRSEKQRSIYAVSETTGTLFLQSTETQISAGLRPGGTRPPRTAGSNPNSGGVPLELEEEMSTDPDALDATYSNPSMDSDDLEFIMNQFRSFSGNFEYEMTLEIAAMPWIRKGNVLHITGLLAEDGVTPISLDPALVFDQRLVFDESSETPRMTSTVRTVFWRTT